MSGPTEKEQARRRLVELTYLAQMCVLEGMPPPDETLLKDDAERRTSAPSTSL